MKRPGEIVRIYIYDGEPHDYIFTYDECEPVFTVIPTMDNGLGKQDLKFIKEIAENDSYVTNDSDDTDELAEFFLNRQDDFVAAAGDVSDGTIDFWETLSMVFNRMNDGELDSMTIGYFDEIPSWATPEKCDRFPEV